MTILRIWKIAKNIWVDSANQTIYKNIISIEFMNLFNGAKLFYKLRVMLLKATSTQIRYGKYTIELTLKWNELGSV